MIIQQALGTKTTKSIKNTPIDKSLLSLTVSQLISCQHYVNEAKTRRKDTTKIISEASPK